MRPQFSYRANRAGRLWGRMFATIAVVLVVLGVDTLSSGAIRAMVRTAAASTAGVVAGTGYVSTRSSLLDQIASLENEISRARESTAIADALRRENEELRSLARLAQSLPGISAPLQSPFASSPYGTFLIGAGSADGVQAGDVVLTPGGFVLGRVSEAGEQRSVAVALFAPAQRTEAVIGSVSAELVGRGGGNARAEVPRDAVVALGDTAVALEYGGRPIGVVGVVESDPARAEQTIYVRTPVNLDTLRFVYVTRAAR